MKKTPTILDEDKLVHNPALVTTTPAPELPFTIKGNLRDYTRVLGVGRPLLALLVSLIIWLRFGFALWLLVAIGISVAIFIGFLLLKMRTLTLSADGIQYRDAFLRTHTLAYTDVEQVKAFAAFYDANFGKTVRVIIGAKTADAPISMNGFYWLPEDLDKLLAILRDKKVPTEYYDQAAQFGDIAQQFPTYASLIERRPGTVGVVLALVIILGITLFAFATAFRWF